MSKKLSANSKLFILEIKIFNMSKKYLYLLNDTNTNKYTGRKYFKLTKKIT